MKSDNLNEQVNELFDTISKAPNKEIYAATKDYKPKIEAELLSLDQVTQNAMSQLSEILKVLITKARTELSKPGWLTRKKTTQEQEKFIHQLINLPNHIQQLQGPDLFHTITDFKKQSIIELDYYQLLSVQVSVQADGEEKSYTTELVFRNLNGIFSHHLSGQKIVDRIPEFLFKGEIAILELDPATKEMTIKSKSDQVLYAITSDNENQHLQLAPGQVIKSESQETTIDHIKITKPNEAVKLLVPQEVKTVFKPTLRTFDNLLVVSEILNGSTKSTQSQLYIQESISLEDQLQVNLAQGFYVTGNNGGILCKSDVKVQTDVLKVSFLINGIKVTLEASLVGLVNEF